MRRAALVAATALAVLLPASPAAATSCTALTGTPDAPVVLVGTVQAAWSEHARLAVDEVWAGPDLAPVVWVEAVEDDDLGGDYLVPGERYVVTADESFRTGLCEVAAVGDVTRPSDVREPVEGGVTGADAPRPLAEVLAWGAGGAALVGAVVLLVRRRRPP
ncbi:hypothetical protein, partial [Aeromicrobium sp. IC_218]|uniref:hypothetical protein n=1 Tax=Aeromicrobium sp. IC_218 TaxID=2545468 RepID=UPI0010406C75